MDATAVPRFRWGILGTASIAMRQVIPALQQSGNGEVRAIASRERPRAESVAREARIAVAYDSYDALLDDAAIDGVYIPLPNHLHLPWSLAALAAGKHVLCEKPIGLDAGEASELAAAASRHPSLRVMEAFMYRCHPRWHRVRAMLQDGTIGELGSVHTSFTYSNLDPANIRNQAATGGGGLLDIGCYGVSVARYLFGAEPDGVEASVELDPKMQIDRLTSAVLTFGRGSATLTCATQLTRHQHVTVIGSEGRIELELPFNPPADRPTTIQLVRGGETEAIALAPCNQYQIQGEQFVRAVRENSAVPVPLSDSVANMTVIDTIARAGRQHMT